MSGVELIAAERQRQVDVEKWTAEHDDNSKPGALTNAAECYCVAADFIMTEGSAPQQSRWSPPRYWPWAEHWWKPSPDPIRNLVKAGALIAAEIDRLQRMANATAEGGGE